MSSAVGIAVNSASVGTEGVSLASVEVVDGRSTEAERWPKIDSRLFGTFGGGVGASQPQSSSAFFDGTGGEGSDLVVPFALPLVWVVVVASSLVFAIGRGGCGFDVLCTGATTVIAGSVAVIVDAMA
jgi:hypothetical protein